MYIPIYQRIYQYTNVYTNIPMYIPIYQCTYQYTNVCCLFAIYFFMNTGDRYENKYLISRGYVYYEFIY